MRKRILVTQARECLTTARVDAMLEDEQEVEVVDVGPGRAGVNEMAQSLEEWIGIVANQRAPGIQSTCRSPPPRVAVDHGACGVRRAIGAVRPDPDDPYIAQTGNLSRRREGEFLGASTRAGSFDRHGQLSTRDDTTRAHQWSATLDNLPCEGAERFGGLPRLPGQGRSQDERPDALAPGHPSDGIDRSLIVSDDMVLDAPKDRGTGFPVWLRDNRC